MSENEQKKLNAEVKAARLKKAKLKSQVKAASKSENQAPKKEEVHISPLKTNPPEEEPEKDDETAPSAVTVLEIEGGMRLEVSPDKLCAYLFKTNEFDPDITVEEVYAILAGNMIQYGIADQQMIEGFIRSSGFKKNGFQLPKENP